MGVMVLLAAAALALAGCGRKGPLDLPPSASPEAAAAAQANADTSRPQGRACSIRLPMTVPTAAKGAKRSFVLDPLLGN